MGVDVTRALVIRRPRGQVFAYAADPRHAPRWYSRIEKVDWRGGEVVGEGDEAAFIARFLGREIAYTYRVVELAPPERLTMRTAEGPFPMETQYTFEDVPEGTRMAIRNRGDPAGFWRIAAPVMEAAMGRAVAGDLRRLKALLGSDGFGA